MNPQDPNAPSPGDAPPAEDASSQALAEAMRSSFVIVQIIMVALVLVFLGSGFFTVGPQEAAIKLRLGKPVDGGRLLGPGLWWAFPAPIDEVVKLRITSLTTADSSVGWYQTPAERAAGAPEPPPMPKLNPANITYALTADTNIIHVRATAQYRITDPTVFHFNFVNAPYFITNALDNALLRASSEFPVDGILSSNRAAFRERVQRQVIELVEAEHLGVTVDQVDVGSSAPLYLKNMFDEVTKAMQRRGKVINDAQTYATNTVAKASGDADTRVKVADAERKWKVDTMAAQADTFTKLLAQYERDPELFKRIKQMSVLASIYTNVTDKIMVPPNSHEYRFQLSREPQEPSISNIPAQP
jgi:modulator of FtsH protease HflK